MVLLYSLILFVGSAAVVVETDLTASECASLVGEVAFCAVQGDWIIDASFEEEK